MSGEEGEGLYSDGVLESLVHAGHSVQPWEGSQRWWPHSWGQGPGASALAPPHWLPLTQDVWGWAEGTLSEAHDYLCIYSCVWEIIRTMSSTPNQRGHSSLRVLIPGGEARTVRDSGPRAPGSASEADRGSGTCPLPADRRIAFLECCFFLRDLENQLNPTRRLVLSVLDTMAAELSP